LAAHFQLFFSVCPCQAMFVSFKYTEEWEKKQAACTAG